MRHRAHHRCLFLERCYHHLRAIVYEMNPCWKDLNSKELVLLWKVSPFAVDLFLLFQVVVAPLLDSTICAYQMEELVNVRIILLVSALRRVLVKATMKLLLKEVVVGVSMVGADLETLEKKEAAQIASYTCHCAFCSYSAS